LSQEPKVTRFGALPTVDSELATKAYVDSAASGLTFARVVKSVTETINSDSVLHNDDELFFVANANKTYGGIIGLHLESGSTPDFKSALSIPSGASARRVNGSWGTSATAVADFTVAQVIPMTGPPGMLAVYFRVIITTAGTVNYQWAQNVSNAGDTSVLQGSFMTIWEEA